MADIKPNPKLALQRIRMDISKLEATVERQRYELIEMEDRKERTEENIEATLKALVDLRKKLDEMQKRKGE